ncbi:MAG: glycosyltransferase family 39 protein [Hyphomonadaceae bacterium]|nr:glycosyltransferase family 39 protein [Hyphomonadaceae bacterium]
MPFSRAAFDRATLAFLVVLTLATAARIYALIINPLGLYFDEAQYWMWSRSFDWGYFTKPPMVAWIIAATTTLTGTDTEWAVRLGAPLAHALAAGGVFALTRSMYGAWPGFWAGLGWLALPGVFLSSSLVSTDAFLLPLWALALLAVWQLMSTRAWGWAIALGVFIGLGVLAKYAMFYFIACLALAAYWLAPVREALAKGRGVAAGVVAAIIVAPNLIWNVQHGFATARHTASNASFNLDNMFHIGELWEFLTGQAGVIGPLVYLALIWVLWRAARRSAGLQTEDRFLIAFILPPLVFVSLIAFISRANANWVAVAYPAIMVWVTGSLFTSKRGRRVLAAATALNAVLGFATVAYVASAPNSAPRIIKGARESSGWEATAREIARRAAVQPGEPPFTAVMADDRATYFELSYYWRHARREAAPLPPLRMWVLHGEPANSAEANDGMRPEEGGRVLIVHLRPDLTTFVADDFTTFRRVERLSVPIVEDCSNPTDFVAQLYTGLGGNLRPCTRDFDISVGEGFAPAPRDAAFEARLAGRDEP